jgi:site-specific DNA recombinase
MLLKKGIRHLRYSHDKQSYHSIERQDHVTSQWMNFNKVEITDTFKDEGCTARTFDRPDIKLLFEFIQKITKGSIFS